MTDKSVPQSQLPLKEDKYSHNTIEGAFRRFIEAEKKNSPILFWAFLVGSLSGLVGAVFRIFLVDLTIWRESFGHLTKGYTGLTWVLPTLISALMVYLSLLLVRRFAPETGGSGVHEIEGALDELRPVRWKRVLPVKFLGGLLSLGGGMVLGREGPTIQMGGNVGKMVGDLFKVPKDEVHVLIVAGAGAGLSAAFNAPLAGILFVIEEMRPQFKFTFLSFQSVMIASAMSDIVLRCLLGQGPDVELPLFPTPRLSTLWMFIIFGGIFGLFGFLFNKLVVMSLDLFSGMRGWSYSLIGIYMGAIIGFLGWISPNLIGDGTELITRLAESSFPLTTILILFIARFGTTIFSYGSGAPGGIFAPMLALGTLFGLWSGHIVHGWFPSLIIHPGIFAVAGMGALFSATVRAPLTGIALAVEITSNYSQILPLILTCISATVVAQGLGGKPIYTVLLDRTLNLEKNQKI